jgi:5-methylcytosine-specific restriction endonuclease McrA
MTNTEIALLGAAAAVVLFLIVFGRTREVPRKTDSQRSIASQTEQPSPRPAETRVQSYEIPVPDDFVYRHRAGKRASPTEKRRRRQARESREARLHAEREEATRQKRLREASEQRRLRSQARSKSPIGFTTEWLAGRLQRQQNTCFWCGSSIHGSEFHLDHVWPLSLGGVHDVANLVVSCEYCNLSKGSRAPWEFLDSAVPSTRWHLVRDELETLGIGISAASSRQTPHTVAQEQGEQLEIEWIGEDETSIYATSKGSQVILRLHFD